MARVGIIFGLLLCGLTFLGLISMEQKSPYQFYPMMLGIPVLFCGVVALNPHRRKHAMHVTAVLALVGTTAGGVGCLRRLLEDQVVDRYGLPLIGSMSILCLFLLLACIASFRAARKRKEMAV